MKKQDNFITITDFGYWVSPTEIKTRLTKYKTKATETNYLIQDNLTDDEWKDGFRGGVCQVRIKKESILKIQTGHLYDSFKSIYRGILYLEGQETEARKLLMEHISSILSQNSKNTSDMEFKWAEKLDKEREIKI